MQEFRLPALLLGVRQCAHEGTQAGAVEKADLLQIHQQIDVAFLEKAYDRLLEGGLRLTDDQITANGQNRDPPVATDLELHRSSEIMSETFRSGVMRKGDQREVESRRPSRLSRVPAQAGASAEARRLEEDRRRKKNWKRWGPYLAERAWGTVREDYSPDGAAWDYFPHHQAPSKTYRWNEDGLAGLCDRHQFICFALALWNGRDPILKERLFGLAGPEGNHGEDAKECYFYLDSTPTHSYMKCLYKYPQREFPYAWLVEENQRRGRQAPEFELIDTGVFDEDRYFDVFTEYAKGSPNDVLVRITAVNRGPERATLSLLPTIWYRNLWSWGLGLRRPRLWAGEAPEGRWLLELDSDYYGRMWLHGDGEAELLFTENETNFQRLYGA